MKQALIQWVALLLCCPLYGQLRAHEEAELIPEDLQAFDRFGCSISLSCGQLVVGARSHDASALHAGAAYVFQTSGASWRRLQKLTASDAGVGDNFGFAVAIDGDTLVATAPQYDTGVIDCGAAYVFVRTNGVWLQTGILVASDAYQWLRMGMTVDISGDRIALGAPHDSTGGNDAGAVYVFRRQGSAWVEEAKLLYSAPAAKQLLGFTVDMDRELVVATIPSGGLKTGRAVVFERQGTTWSEVAALVASGSTSTDGYATTAVVSGTRVAVGAPSVDFGKNKGFGAVYIFERQGSAWIEVAKLQPDIVSGQVYLGNFGERLAFDGDWLAVGAPLTYNGVVYPFHYDGGQWSDLGLIVPIGHNAGESIPTSLAIDGATFAFGSEKTTHEPVDTGMRRSSPPARSTKRTARQRPIRVGPCPA